MDANEATKFLEAAGAMGGDPITAAKSLIDEAGKLTPDYEDWDAEQLEQSQQRMQQREAEFKQQRAAYQEEQQACLAEIKADGNAAFKAGKNAEAVRCYTEAIDMDFTLGERDEKLSAQLYANRAAAKIKQAEIGFDEEWEAAERDCRRALERDPQAKYYVRCAKALSEGLERYSDAFHCLCDALALEPANTAVREALATLRTEHADVPLGSPSTPALQKLRKRAAAAAAKGAHRLEAACNEALALIDVDAAAAATTSAASS